MLLNIYILLINYFFLQIYLTYLYIQEIIQYFLDTLNFSKNIENNEEGKEKVFGYSKILKPLIGDVLKIYFSKKGSYYFFEGFCYSIYKKSFLKFDTGIKLISKYKNVFIFFNISFFANLIFSFEKVDFKKMKIKFTRSKITSYKKLKL